MRVVRRSAQLLGFLALCVGCEPAANEVVADPESPVACRIVAGPVQLPVEIDESSGAVIGRNDPAIVWTHNDSGGEAELFAVTRDGELRARVRVPGATNRDWEDIAIADCPENSERSCLFVGDIGDNSAVRSEIVVYSVPEPSLPASQSRGARAYAMRYPDGARDAEALFVVQGVLYIISKGDDAPITLYRYPGTLRSDTTVVLERVRSLSDGPVPLGDRVTGADASEEGDWVLVRTYRSVLAYPTTDLLRDDGAPVNVDLTPIAEGQGEGIAVGSGGEVVLTSEGFDGELPGSLVTLACDFLLQPVGGMAHHLNWQ